MQVQSEVRNSVPSLGPYAIMFGVFLLTGFTQLYSLERVAFRRGGGIGLALEMAAPLLVMLGFGVSIWMAAKRKAIDVRAAGLSLIVLGLVAFVTYDAIKDFSTLTR